MQLVRGAQNRPPSAPSGEQAEPDDAASAADTVTGARAVFNRAERWALLAAFTLIVMFRLPHAWAHGRFQDEEATVFLAYAWHHGSLDALFRPFAGYWNFAADATTLLVARLVQSGIVSLERAPYLTMMMALAVQVLPGVLILTGRAQWLANRACVVAALLMIAIMPATEEVFFNILHIQFHLALCVALILALDVPERGLAKIGYGALLFVAPLCGPGAIVVLPLFALRAFVDRDAGRLMQLGALVLGSTVQLLLFYGASPIRGRMFDAATLAAGMFVRLIALPLIGTRLSLRLGLVILGSRTSGGTLWWWFAAASVLLFGTLLIAAARRRDGAIWLALSGLSISAVSLGMGMVAGERYRLPSLFEVVEGERYNFLPLVLLGLAMISMAARPMFRGRAVCVSLCLVALLSAALYYPNPSSMFAEGPSWPAEVGAWRKDHRHPLAVWPRPWTADLSDETRPCVPPSRNPPQVPQPRYCESGWAAGFYS